MRLFGSKQVFLRYMSQFHYDNEILWERGLNINVVFFFTSLVTGNDAKLKVLNIVFYDYKQPNILNLNLKF